ncbi:MAG TPA: cytochrome o ubiquinol oxidase subunit IV [Candidatus Saccharimonadales bacterium]|nr:cytochrome o ubiquinol oxidase subunit IV [Candidatus Saccharimonadales bacterium]
MSQETYKKQLTGYIIGFILSISLTLLAYFLVVGDLIAKRYVLVLIFVLAVVQLFVQLVFFLHLSSGERSKWRWITLGFGVLVVLIVGIGSLWIMDHLNYNMMHSPQKMEEYMHRQGGF